MADILVVDDDASVRDLARSALVTAGHDVQAVQNGGEGLRMLAAFRFHLAVIDIVVPRSGGIEMVRTVRRSGDVMPILVTVGGGGVAQAHDPLAQAIILGVNRALPKPLQPSAFLHVVEEMLLSGPRYFS
jgi:CheY-like chemotaxis protein